MLLTLQMRGRVPAETLAREFEVSSRTIYRDVDALSAAGVPIYAESGRNGGIKLHEGYRTRLTGLTSAEAAALPVAGLAQAARDLGVSAEAAAAQLKMLASLNPDSAATAQRIAARFHIDPLPWYHRNEEVECLFALADAVWSGKRIAVSYQSWKGGVTRRLDPLGLVQKGGYWYLVAASRNKPRTYRVSNICELRVLNAPAQRVKRFDLAAYWNAATRSFEENLMAQRAVIRISAEGERILRAVMPAAAELVARTRAPCGKAGWSQAEAPFESSDYSARQFLRLGSEIEILAPESLRRAVLTEARAIAALYRGASKHPRPGKKATA
jgi:predicted DNA-binding transcriptional regulator YafY